jgi:cell division septal protein FtsQ
MAKYRKIKKKKSIFKNRFFWFGIISLIIIIGLCYLFFVSPVFKIKKVEILGSFKFLTTQEISLKTEKILSKNILFLNTKEIKNELLKDFLILNNVEVRRKLFSKVEILAMERKPVANFRSNEKCFFVDKEGIVFKEIAVDSLYITLIPSKPEEIKYPQVISKELLDSILLAKDEMKKMIGLEAKECIFAPLKLEIKTDQGWKAILDPKKDIENQISNLNLVFKNKIGESNASKIDYIDVRLDKIFYMMK